MSSTPNASRSKYPLPPGPRGLPVVGTLFELLGSEPGHIALAKLAKRYGDICLLPIGSESRLVIGHPELMKEAFDKEEISERWANEIFTLLSEGEGLLYSAYNENWRTVGPLGEHELWSQSDMAGLEERHFAPTVDEAAERMCRMADAGEPVHPLDLLTASNFDLAFRALFGWESDYDDDFRNDMEALRERIAWFAVAAAAPNIADVFLWTRIVPSKMLREGRRQRDARDRIIRALLDSVARRRASDPPARPGMVDTLLAREEAGGIDRGTICALCTDLLGAIPSGVAATVGWFLLIVANRPEVQARIHEELDRAVGRDRLPTGDDRAQLPYTFACVAESMRYRTIAPLGIPHRTARETVVASYRIPANTQVLGSIYSVHHDERFWESPDEFIPERFMPQVNGSPPAALTSLAYMPFGIGIRRCTGDHFAVTAFWLHAVRMLHRLRFETPEGASLSEEEVWGLSVAPKPYVLKAIRRRG